MNFDYQVIRRPRRKTASISVNPDCSVRVVVPSTLPEHKVVDLVKKKSRWIEGKIDEFKEYKESHQEKSYVSGESFSYLGKNYRLKVLSGARNGDMKLVNGKFVISIPTEMSDDESRRVILLNLTEWYRAHAGIRLREKTRRYADQIGVNPVSVGVKDYRSRWGGCHIDGRIYYNWRIIMAPHTVIDYVVVHELCHLTHADHSPKFWKLVESIIPDYKERKQWLKMNGRGLVV